MHDLFYGSGRGTLEQQSVARFRSGVNTMLLHPESAPLVVEGISVTGKNVKAAADGIEEDIRRAACATAENFWDKIDLIPSFYRRSVDRPQKVHFMELDCFFVPVLALVRHGELWILESNAANDDGELISCLHRMWTANELGRDPTLVKSLYLDEGFQLRELDPLPSVSASLDEIRRTISEMEEAAMDGYVTIADFPPSPGSVCPGCQFRTFCEEKKNM